MNEQRLESTTVGKTGNPLKQPPWLRREKSFVVRSLACAVCAIKRVWTTLETFCSKSNQSAEQKQPIDYEMPQPKLGKKVSGVVIPRCVYDWEKRGMVNEKHD